jgi:transcriptional regulator with PAS, ATPase and Fis domain
VEVHAGELIEVGTAMLVVQASHEGQEGARAEEGRSAGAADSESPMDRLKRLVALVSRGQLSVILLGETGVGKDVLATRIHESSSRAGGPFVKLNCAAFTESLLEGELFGYERGAFTGAVKAKAGLIESGSGGTVFLDELGEMPPTTQVKLLRVLENREVLRLGSVAARRIDVRFVSATHRDLSALIVQGMFRQDLFFRLNGITITVPPLRQRRAEILPLAASFLAEEQARQGIPRGAGISARARALLLGHAWPGNIRELKNVVERAVALSAGAEIEVEHLMFDPSNAVPGATASTAPLSQGVAAFERERIRLALERTHGNQTEAAKDLGISRRTLVSRLGEYDLPRPRKGQSDCG